MGHGVKAVPPRADTLDLFGDNEESPLVSVTALEKDLKARTGQNVNVKVLQGQAAKFGCHLVLLGKKL